MLDQNVSLEGKTVLVTGAAGFIGSALVRRLLHDVSDIRVVGIDSITDYYDVNIKYGRLREIEEIASAAQSAGRKEWLFIKGNIADKQTVEQLFADHQPAVVVNLAAQAGVRYSITNPDAYIESNLIGFYNILEACRHHMVEHLVYASSSSVYGSNTKIPYSTDDKVDNPVSLYAATKKSNELMAHAYSKLYGIPCTGLRFFTVYGPAGRPDMAYFGFTDKLVHGDTIKIFNYGNCMRDFTYIDDIVEGIVRVIGVAPQPEAYPKSFPEGKDLQASPQPSPEGKGDWGVRTANPLYYGLLKQYAEENRNNPTEAESVLWEALKGNGLGVKFRRQHIIEDFIVDFFCCERKLTIELDGGYHNRPEQMKSDVERTARLHELGYTELRFTNEEVTGNIDEVLHRIIKSFPSGEDLGEASLPSLQGRAGDRLPFPSGEGRGEAAVPYIVYNIGNSSPVNLLDFVTILQEELVRAGVLPEDYDFEAHKELVPMQPGDVAVTYADTTPLERDFGYKPNTPLRVGLRHFAEWYAKYRPQDLTPHRRP